MTFEVERGEGGSKLVNVCGWCLVVSNGHCGRTATYQPMLKGINNVKKIPVGPSGGGGGGGGAIVVMSSGD